LRLRNRDKIDLLDRQYMYLYKCVLQYRTVLL
jgi:hypothetical protein